MGLIYPIFYAFLRLQFPNVETNTGSRRPDPDVRRILYSNVRGLSWAEGWLHMCEMDMEHYANPKLSVVVAKSRCLGFVVRHTTFMYLVHTAILT